MGGEAPSVGVLGIDASHARGIERLDVEEREGLRPVKTAQHDVRAVLETTLQNLHTHTRTTHAEGREHMGRQALQRCSPTTPRAALHESLSSAARTLSIRATGSLSTSWTRRLQHGSQGNEPSSANQQKSLSHYRSLRQYQSHHQSRSHHPCLKLQQTTFPIVSPRRSPPRRSCSSLTKHIQRHHHHLLPR